MNTPLQYLLQQFREKTLSERDKGTSFENLMVQYFKTEPFYKQQYAEVLTYADWVDRHGVDLGVSSKKGLLALQGWSLFFLTLLPVVTRNHI